MMGDDGHIEPAKEQNDEGRPLLLDGGMGHQLKSMGVPIEGEVGTMRRFLGVAMANVDNPKLVQDAHLSFIDAGADIITTNSYAIVPRVFELCAESNITMESMLVASCKAACAARDMRPQKRVLIAGSLPPLAESYRPDRVGEYETNLQDYRRICTTIAPYCDVLLCETMSTAMEAKAACTAAAETGLPVWVSWTLDESKPVLRSGETLQEAIEALSNIEVAAFLSNCTSPESSTKAMPLLQSLVPDGAAIGGYANGFVTSTSGQGEYRDLGDKEYYDDFVVKWISSGATIVGGCCGIFPRHIAHIRQCLDKNKTC